MQPTLKAKRLTSHQTVTLSVTLPSEKLRRLRGLAQARGVSLSDLFDELATMALYDAAAYVADRPPGSDPHRGGDSACANRADQS